MNRVRIPDYRWMRTGWFLIGAIMDQLIIAIDKPIRRLTDLISDHFIHGYKKSNKISHKSDPALHQIYILF